MSRHMYAYDLLAKSKDNGVLPICQFPFPELNEPFCLLQYQMLTQFTKHKENDTEEKS